MIPAAPREWQIVDTLGPVFSEGGFRNWDLCLARHALIGFPRSFWISIRVGMWAGVGLPAEVDRSWRTPAGPTGERILHDPGDRRWRRHAREELSSITVRRCTFGANEIRITRHASKPLVYGLWDRSQTDRCRAVLSGLYPDLYGEERFPR